jgi:NitT/TauT family transport system ATP-binding protein
MFVEIDNVSKVFIDKKLGRGIVALRNIGLNVKRNEFLCIIGPSGCGKTTLLNMIAGFENPTKGKIFLNGEEIKGPSNDKGVIFQEFSLFPWMTALENIKFGLNLQGWPKKEQEKIAKKYLTLVGLEGFEHSKSHELSGGMKQKVAIARTLALDPELLLMDEPFASLDEQTRQDLDIELLNIWREDIKTVIFVTHNIEEAILLADRIIVLTARPGEIYKELKVELQRPRNLFSEEVVMLRKRLRNDLTICCNNGHKFGD